MDLSNPFFTNIEPIKRLVPYVVVYVSLLIILRMFVWPTVERIREQSTLGIVLRRFLRRFLFLASGLLLLFVTVLSLLSITGEDVTITIGRPRLDFDLNRFNVPALGDVVPTVDGYMLILLGIGVALLLIFALFQPWIGK